MQSQFYEQILDSLIEKIGGKEYCLRQLLCENDYKNFTHNYKKAHKTNIVQKITELYSVNIENIIEVEIAQSFWNKYIMKLYFYDECNFRFFEYFIKTEEITEVKIFDYDYDDNDDSDNLKTFPKSFYAKLKGGNLLWEKYDKTQQEKNSEKIAQKSKEENDKFMEKMKCFKFITLSKGKDLNLKESEERFFDGNQRFMLGNIFYYKLPNVNGYMTFNEEKDILLEPYFAKLFYEKIVRKIREN